MLWPTLLAYLGGFGIAEGITYLSGREANRASATLPSALALAVIQSVGLMVLGAFVLPMLFVGKAAIALPAALLYLWLIPINLVSLYAIALLQGRMNLLAFNLGRLSVHAAYT